MLLLASGLLPALRVHVSHGSRLALDVWYGEPGRDLACLSQRILLKCRETSDFGSFGEQQIPPPAQVGEGNEKKSRDAASFWQVNLFAGENFL